VVLSKLENTEKAIYVTMDCSNYPSWKTACPKLASLEGEFVLLVDMFDV